MMFDSILAESLPVGALASRFTQARLVESRRHPMRNLVRCVSALLFCLLASLSQAANVRASGAAVVVNEVPVFQFKQGAGDASAEEIAQRVVARLKGLQGTESVTIDRQQSGYAVKMGDVEIEITSAEAAAQSTTPQALAHSWAARLAHAFALPPIKLVANQAMLPVGRERTIGLVGSLVPISDVRVDNSSVLSAKRVDGGLAIRGLAPGRAQVLISSGSSLETMNVDVKAWAANPTTGIAANVSGAPATEDTVRSVVAGAIRTQLPVAPGASMRFKVPPMGAIGTGVTRSFAIPVSVTAPDALPWSGTVDVSVHNLGLPQGQDAELWYSNDPESVTRPGSLFAGSLKLGAEARMLYHHQNAASQMMYLRVQAINDSDADAKILLMPGDSKPDRNPVIAGLKAADQYLKAWMWGSGEVVTIPAHSTIPISVRRLFPGETASGLCSFRLVSGPPDIQVRTDAWAPFPIDSNWELAMNTSTPWRVVGANPVNSYDRAPYEPSAHVYPNPYRSETMSYKVGGRFGFLRIGQKPIARQDNQGRLDGNFGVIYKIQATVSNPTDRPRDVEIVFEASAGYSGALFIVDGSYVKTPVLAPKGEARVKRYHLSPGAVKHVSMTTLPLSGGSYPITLTIRPISHGAER
jgi:hypothetical protein